MDKSETNLVMAAMKRLIDHIENNDLTTEEREKIPKNWTIPCNKKNHFIGGRIGFDILDEEKKTLKAKAIVHMNGGIKIN